MKLYTTGGVILIVSLTVVLVVEGNVTSSNEIKMDKSSFRDKHYRLITFNTDNDSNVAVSTIVIPYFLFALFLVFVGII